MVTAQTWAERHSMRVYGSVVESRSLAAAGLQLRGSGGPPGPPPTRASFLALIGAQVPTEVKYTIQDVVGLEVALRQSRCTNPPERSPLFV